MEELAKRQFRIGTCLGRGGFGEVYRAVMVSPGGIETDVAVKVLHKDLHPAGQAVQRLMDEGRLIARLDHPAILRVHDLVLLEGRISLITEFVDGQDLGDCLDGAHRIGQRALLEVIGAVAGALHAAWTAPLGSDGGALELVHRDIKPSNIRISRHGQVKLLDFGIARTDTVDREARTQTNLMVGSPAYMAPERFLENAVHAESDIFALGCSLYEGLAGVRLFEEVPMPMMSAMALDSERMAEFVAGRLGLVPNRTSDSVIALLEATLHHDYTARPGAAELMARCEGLADEVGGPSLARWCREKPWPDADEAEGVLEGLEITEGTLTRSRVIGPMDSSDAITQREPSPGVSAASLVSAREDEEAPSSGRAGLALAGVGAVIALLAVLVVGIGVGAMVLGSLQGGAPVPTTADSAPDSPAVDAAPGVVEEVVEPVSEAVVDLEPSPEPVEPTAPAVERLAEPPAEPLPAPEPARSPRPAPEPTPVSPSLAPTPAPVTVHIATAGDIAASLVGPSGRIALPADVPVGAYTIEGRFNGRDYSPGGAITVAADGQYTVSCSARMMRCSVR